MTNVFFYAATLAAFGVLLSGATGTPPPTPLLGSGAVSTLYTSPNGNVSLADHVLYEGFIYATDVTNRVVLRIDPYTAATTVLVGGKPGAAANAEGTGAAAGFKLPRGLAIHEDEGVLLVASVGAILRVDIDTQEVKLHAGQLNQEGFTPPSDGAQAYFRGIYGLTLISEAGDLLATEHTGQWVRFVSAGIAGIRSETWQRSVMVLAGGGIYYVGTVDGPLSLSRVNGPMFITYHAANGAAYFAENGGTGAVRKLAVAEKFLTTVFLAGASTVGISGVGLVPQAGSNDPLVYASIGSKTRAQFIAKVSPSYEVVAGSDVESGSVDGPGLSARFFDIYGPLRFYGGVYGSGFVFAHNGNGSASALRVLGQVNLAAPCASHGRPFRCHHRHETGGRGHHDWRLGNGHGGYRCQQSAITCDVFDGCTGLTCAGVVKCRDTRKCGSLAGHYCEVTGATVSVCSALVPRPTAPPPPPSPMPLANTTVSTVFLSAQDDPSLPWFSDGTFFEGFVYTTVSYANTIVRIDPVSKTYTTIAGGSPLGGNEEGVGTAASLDWPQGLVAQEEGYLLVTAGTAVMRVALADANVALYAGHPYRRGYDWDDGDGSVARFDTLQGIRLLNADGDCIVSDWGSNRIRNITAGSEGITGAPATRKVGSVAGDIYQWGLLDGVGTQAWFYAPWHMGYHQPNGALYVADIGNAAVRKIVLRTSVVTTIFVLDRSELQLWNIGLMASLNPFTTEPAVFATIGGGSGTIISQVSPTYEQVAGSLTAFGGADGPGLNATFYGIEGSLQYLSGAYGSGFLLTDNIDGRTSVRVLGDVNFNTACGAYGGEYQCSRWGRCRKSAITCEVLGGCTGPRCAGVVKCSRYSSCGSLAGHYCEVSGSDTFVCNAAPTNPPTPRSPYGHH